MDRRTLFFLPIGALLTGTAKGALAETCSICKFYTVGKNNTSQGYCKRFPPDYRQNSNAFPIVKALDWCGEFQAK
jgi:hypothetical protein